MNVSQTFYKIDMLFGFGFFQFHGKLLVARHLTAPGIPEVNKAGRTARCDGQLSWFVDGFGRNDFRRDRFMDGDGRNGSGLPGQLPQLQAVFATIDAHRLIGGA